jgi:hypothetical protein
VFNAVKTNEWTKIIDVHKGSHIHAIFLDWQKAFDKVPHDRLISKLKHFGVDGTLLQWLNSFLVGRTQYVVYQGARSEPCAVASGAIQGSVLGPLLFNIFMIDLPKCVTSPIVRYADDSTLYRIIRSQDDIIVLQQDLDTIAAWCHNNGMSLNESKCKVMDISNAAALVHPYVINGKELPYVNTEKLLGVHIASDLKWNVQSEAVRAKSSKLLGFLSRNLNGCTHRVKRLAYLTLIRPNITYGAPAWHPTSVDNVNKLERVQKRAMRFIYGKNNVPHAGVTNILPLRQQLLHIDLTFFKSCLSGKVDLNIMQEVMVGREIRGQPGVHRLIPPKVRTTARVNKYVYRTVNNYNYIDIGQFKDQNMKFLVNKQPNCVAK